ncbi:MAG: aminomethyl-transferring glycine dehydrogenase subunit GcvPA [Dehalococcoidia bacterium]|nr:aminomethyl-transferring glycine dehydrogenase subunit GcvPA [Dehalococcoidia bacterium]
MALEASAPTPYIPNTAADRARMLERIGLPDTAALFAELPAQWRDPPIEVPPALSELELVQLLRRQAAANRASTLPSFLGAGAYRRYIPAVTAHLVSRPEFVTAYTPYQPEISQGTLQAAFEYQSTVCALTGMEVSNTGLYDVASAAAEACLLAARVTSRRAVAILEPFHPGTLEVVRTYAFGADLRVDVLGDVRQLTSEHACVVVQQPDFLGTIVDLERVVAAAREAGALSVVSADPFALGMLRAPGDAGVDVVVGEGRDLAIGVAYGGPSVGLFATRERYLRQVPGRIVGRTRELHGPDGEAPRTGYVLTLQAREQFIRRARATSNFSTGQALIALAFTITLQTLGPEGLRRSAAYCYQAAHGAARRLASIPGYAVVERGPWFQEFLLRGPVPAPELLRRLEARGVLGGLDVSARPEPEARDAILVCVTEMTLPEDLEALESALRAIATEAA